MKAVRIIPKDDCRMFLDNGHLRISQLCVDCLRSHLCCNAGDVCIHNPSAAKVEFWKTEAGVRVEEKPRVGQQNLSEVQQAGQEKEKGDIPHICHFFYTNTF